MEKKANHSASASVKRDGLTVSDCGVKGISRREFGRLVVGTGTAALFASQPVASAIMERSVVSGPGAGRKILTVKTRQATFSIDEAGAFSAIVSNGRNLLAPAQQAPILCIQVAGKLYPPPIAQPGMRPGTL